MYQIDEETYLLFVDFLVLCDAEVFHHLMVLAFDVHPPAIGDISDDEKECQRISYVGRYAQPPRGSDDDAQRSRPVVPQAVIIGSFHLEFIFSGRQVSVGRRVAGGIGNPFFVGTLQAVFVLVFKRLFIAEGHEP